jgi:hypothetical protein
MSEMPKHIDLHYVLGDHSWSSCTIEIGERTEVMVMSHLFSCPLTDFLYSLIELLDGDKEVSFCWLDEPGGYKWDISRNELDPKVLIVHISWLDSNGGWSESDKVLSEIEFQVEQRFLVACVYAEVIKINELMKIKSYNKDRNKNYPYKVIKQYEKKYIETYS